MISALLPTWNTPTMRQHHFPSRLLGVLAILTAGYLLAPVTHADEPFGKPLFDGKTFDGWEGNLQIFRIEDGAIVGGTLKAKVPHNDFLAAKQEFADFELRLKFKCLGEGVNGGIQIRSRRMPNHFEMIGYQADMGNGYWGALYDESRRKKVLATPKQEDVLKVLKLKDWNDYRIRCEGRHIQLWVNGLATVDYTETDEKLEQTGLIAVQIHGGGPSECWYKDIRIEDLTKK